MVGRACRVLRHDAVGAIGIVTRVTARTATAIGWTAGDISVVASPTDTSVSRTDVAVVALCITGAPTINLAVDLVLAAFADAIAAAEGDRRRITAAIHGAVAGFLARPSANAVSTTSLAPAAAGTTAVRRATDTVLAVSVADAVSARAATVPDAVAGAVVAVLAGLTDAVIITGLRFAPATDTNLTRRAGDRIVGTHPAGATVHGTGVIVIAFDRRVRASPGRASIDRAVVGVVAIERIVDAGAARTTVRGARVAINAFDRRV